MSDEGRNTWISIDELKNTPSENKIQDYLPEMLFNTACEKRDDWQKEDRFG